MSNLGCRPQKVSRSGALPGERVLRAPARAPQAGAPGRLPNELVIAGKLWEIPEEEVL